MSVYILVTLVTVFFALTLILLFLSFFSLVFLSHSSPINFVDQIYFLLAV